MEMLLFLMAVRTNCMPLPKCEKCDYFTDTPGFMLFKAHNIQNLLVLPAHQTPSVLHSFHSQHFRSVTQRLSSDNISFYLEREMCLCLWIIPHHFPHVQVFLESFKNMMPVPRFKLLIFILLYISHRVEFVLLLGENNVCGLQDFRETALGDLMSVDMFMWWKEQPLISLGVIVAEDLCWFAK